MILYNQSQLSSGWINSPQVGLKPVKLSFKPDDLLVGFLTAERKLLESSVGIPQGKQTEAPHLVLKEGASDLVSLLILYPALPFDEIGDDRDVKVLTLIGQVGPVERDEP